LRAVDLRWLAAARRRPAGRAPAVLPPVRRAIGEPLTWSIY